MFPILALVQIFERLLFIIYRQHKTGIEDFDACWLSFSGWTWSARLLWCRLPLWKNNCCFSVGHFTCRLAFCLPVL